MARFLAYVLPENTAIACLAKCSRHDDVQSSVLKIVMGLERTACGPFALHTPQLYER